jgi:hypothetical protein
MAATVQIHEMSALATGVDKTSGTVRFKDADNATVDTNNVLVVPAAGSIYSYSKMLRAFIAVVPTVQIGNLRWYVDAACGWVAGCTAQITNKGVTWAANIKTAIASSADLWTYVAASPMDGDSVDTGPFLNAGGTVYVGDLLRLQATVASTAVQGSQSAEVLTLAFDEV